MLFNLRTQDNLPQDLSILSCLQNLFFKIHKSQVLEGRVREVLVGGALFSLSQYIYDNTHDLVKI